MLWDGRWLVSCLVDDAAHAGIAAAGGAGANAAPRETTYVNGSLPAGGETLMCDRMDD